MDSCCTRTKTKKDYLALPKAIGVCVIALSVMLSIEISIFYAIGII